MRVSIVTTCRNAARFLPTCLASVASQEGVELEHIVTDAASTDGTVELLRQHPDVQWTSEPDGGMCDGINKGFRRATGDWVMWLNADDYFLPGALAKAARFAEAHPEADLFYADTHFVDETGALMRVKREHRFDPQVLLYYGCYIPSTACFIRREWITSGHWLDPALRVCMDYDLYLRLYWAGARFGYLPEPLAAFRWHGQNTSLLLDELRIAELRQIQQRTLVQSGRSWLSGKRTLQALYWVYLLKRRWLKLVGRSASVAQGQSSGKGPMKS